jgi:hypothetical protein
VEFLFSKLVDSFINIFMEERLCFLFFLVVTSIYGNPLKSISPHRVPARASAGSAKRFRLSMRRKLRPEGAKIKSIECIDDIEIICLSVGQRLMINAYLPARTMF